jgi:hypothetical protein
MFQLLELSPDVDRLLALADQAGPKGIELLLHRLKKLHGAKRGSGPQADGAPAPVRPDLH